eukprot:7554692-Pyramimonas_sp.AAC.1
MLPETSSGNAMGCVHPSDYTSTRQVVHCAYQGLMGPGAIAEVGLYERGHAGAVVGRALPGGQQN